MIELSDEQRKAIEKGKAVRVRENDHEFVVLRPDVYDQLSAEFDDGPWTSSEMDALRDESTTYLDNFGKTT